MKICKKGEGKRILVILLAAVLFMGSLFPVTAEASGQAESAGTSGQTEAAETSEQAEPLHAVYDEGNLFTDRDEADLEKYAKKYGAKSNVRYYIITQNVFLQSDPDEEENSYEEEFLDEEEFLNEDENSNVYNGNIEGYTIDLSEQFYNEQVKPSGYTDAVIFTIVIEYECFKDKAKGNYSDRYADVFGQGSAKISLDANRAQGVFDKAKPSLSDADFKQAAIDVMRTATDYMQYRPGIDPSLVIFRLWFQVLLAMIIAGIVVGIMLYHSGGKMTVNNRTYLDAGHSRILARRDVYLRTTVTKTKKESSSSSGGGGHSGGGGGGGSHGGGHF